MRLSNLAMYRVRLNTILDQNTEVTNIQQKLSTGKKFLRSSEDPITAERIKSLNDSLQRLGTYSVNTTAAKTRLSLEESTINTFVNSLTRVNELRTLALNGTLNNTDRNNIASELEAILDQLISLANSQDPGGEFLFAGFQSDTRPFVNTGGAISYQGDQGARFVDIGTSNNIRFTDSGFAVFEDILNGNGTFATNDGPSVNTGSGIISNGSVTDAASYVADTYTITFALNGGGNLSYSVVGATSGQVVPPLPQVIPINNPDYVDGGTINFNGIAVEISGTPAVGDDFQVQPSSRQNIFTTVQNMITALKTPINNANEEANFRNTITRNAAALEQGQAHMIEFLANIGTRMNVVDAQEKLNQSITQEDTTALSALEDVDLVEAASQFQQEVFALQLAQESFARVQSLTLFNVL